MSYRLPTFLTAAIFALLFFSHCEDDTGPTISAINFPEGNGFPLLSDYNFFIGDLKELNPNEAAGVIPYDLNMALFSDYAQKKRFIYVPDGQTIPFDTTTILAFPVGSILIKHFYYSQPSEADYYVETRLLLRKEEGWQPEIYIWNADQTDADRSVIGEIQNLSIWANGEIRDLNYLIPNQNQCKNCHGHSATIHPIGPMLQNLDKNYDYADGTANQIDTWISRGVLENPAVSTVNAWPKIDDASASLSNKARAYLHVNCASCHSLDGSAANSGLYLSYHNQDSLSLGFWKTPVAAGDGSGGRMYSIYPGEADESIMVFRMESDAVEIRMPEIGRDIVHEEGVELIRDWINSH